MDSVQECAEDFVSVVSAELVEVLVIGELAFGEEREPVFDVFGGLFVRGGVTASIRACDEPSSPSMR